MSDGVETETPPSDRGCLGKGCFIFLGLSAFLSLALLAGTFWGVRYLRGYSATAPVSLAAAEPNATATAEVPVQNDPAALVAETTSPPFSPEETRQLERKWKTFEQAAERREVVRIELSASEINALIAASEARDQIFVAIEENVGRVEFSVPLNDVFMMEGRFLNGHATVEAAPDGDPKRGRISNIVLNGQRVPDGVLDQGMLGLPSIRTFVTDWLAKQRVATFRIENNKVIGETRGGD